MTPIQRIRDDPGKVREMLAARDFDAPLERILELDKVVRELKARKETLQAERNKASRGGPPSEAVKARMREVGDQVRTIDGELATAESELDERLLWIPNEIHPKVPRGKDEHDNVWLVPTAEPQLVGLHRDEILDFATLPRRYVAFTPCYRREHMSAGRDVRGIKRVHWFDKVEMVVHCLPEDSPKWLDRMTELAVEVVEKLELPVRVTERCTGDLGFTALRGFDVDAWGPAANEWLEVSSASNCGSFQAERSNIRFRREAGGKAEHVHILNASGVALPRLMIAIMENYQQKDGSLLIPKAVRAYIGGRDCVRVGEFSL